MKGLDLKRPNVRLKFNIHIFSSIHGSTDFYFNHLDIGLQSWIHYSLTDCEPTFICMWELLVKLARASLSQIFLAIDQYLPNSCIKKTGVD